MKKALLIQLPIPQINFGKQTGNIPLGPACLKMASAGIPDWQVDILPESLASYLCDAALYSLILDKQPDVVGFSVYAWNVKRALYLSEKLKDAYNPLIIFGGPEMTPVNDFHESDPIDFIVFGEGEKAFTNLLKNDDLWEKQYVQLSAGKIFSQMPSAYPLGLLEPEIENMVLVETMRGCPYNCGYCYYNKSGKGLSFAHEPLVLEAIQWAVENKIPELYLLDPSINTRKGLKTLLRKIAAINPDRQLKLISEIRAEAVDEELADLFTAAGFNWFEIGLQSTNPAALSIMKRPTHLKQFLRGTRLLKEREIRTGIDLIVGLPGDDPEGFLQSMEFVVENNLDDDIQVFPLSVLPGTDFRKNHKTLGLKFNTHPPYIVIETPTFSSDQIQSAIEMAEDRFDMALYPFPDLDLSGVPKSRKTWHRSFAKECVIKDRPFILKLFLNRGVGRGQVEQWAGRLSHPYQIFFSPDMDDMVMICDIISVISG